MSKKKLKYSDILLLLLYLPGTKNIINEPIDGMTKLTKMIFLFEQEISTHFNKNTFDEVNKPEFFAYNYGPFSKDLYDQVSFFENIHFIKIVERNDDNFEMIEEAENEFFIEDAAIDLSDDELYAVKSEARGDSSKLIELTEEGIKYVEDNLVALLQEDQKKLLTEFKRKINSLSLHQILDYVYNKYESYTDKSLIRDKHIRK